MSGKVQRSLWERMADKFTIDDGCWEWVASCSTNGYGQIWVDGTMRRPHRVLYEMMVGSVPEGLDLDHLCRNRRCVNPSHLEPVTRQENALRGAKGRMITHCPQHHEYTPENTWRRPSNGHRQCRQCNRDRARARAAA
jgi:hypothetical protein